MNISENIKHYRKMNKMTQADLASKLNVGLTSVSAWETGRTKPLMDKVTIMATLFGVTTSDIVGDTFENQNTYDVSDLDQQINTEVQSLEENDKKKILDFIYDLKTNKKRNQLNQLDINFLDLAKNLSNTSIVSVTELANYAIRTIEDTGSVRKQVQDLLKDCKIFIDEEKTNTAEFINVRRKIYEILLPLAMFTIAYEDNINTIEAFSKHFNLSREFLIEAIGYYATFKGSVFEHNHYLIDISNIPLEYSDINEVNDSKIIVTNTNKKEATKKKRFFK